MGKVSISHTLAVGMAMFSMFFGAGNITFPISLGQQMKGMSGAAILGFNLTAVLVPFFGLIVMSKYKGDYWAFFRRLGAAPAWFIVVVIMALVGPFGALPRCIVIAHSTFSSVYPGASVMQFSLVSCALIFLLTFWPSKVLDVLGKFLTPILLVALLVIIFKGLNLSGELGESEYSFASAFTFGLTEGYNTMDLFAAFIFSGVVLKGLEERISGGASEPALRESDSLGGANLMACSFAMILLAIVYTGMCFVAASNGGGLDGVAQENLLSQLTLRVLGANAGIVVCLAVICACLTTAIALAVVFSDFLVFLSRKWLPYRAALGTTLALSFVIANLEFSGIQTFLVPILQVMLPSLILLSILNYRYKRTGFSMVKTPVFLLLSATFIFIVFY